MTQVALIFPGQGAQKVGMGREFYDSSPEAKAVFDEANRVLGNGLTDVIFNGPAEKLTSTAYCQPGILVFSLAALAAFRAHPKYKLIEPKFTAGLSLGEYTALAASGALPLEATLKLVAKRCAYMEEATRQAAGKMAAIIGMEKDKVVEICRRTGAEVANFNSPAQIVITGHASKVEAACEVFRQEGAKSVIPLDVSGAFHSSLMQSAADKFRADLQAVRLSKPSIAVAANVNGLPADDPAVILQNLSSQMTSSVQWVDTVTNIAKAGVTTFIEIGPGKVLCGLIKRIDRSLKTCNIETPADIEALSF